MFIYSLDFLFFHFVPGFFFYFLNSTKTYHIKSKRKCTINTDKPVIGFMLVGISNFILNWISFKRPCKNLTFYYLYHLSIELIIASHSNSGLSPLEILYNSCQLNPVIPEMNLNDNESIYILNLSSSTYIRKFHLLSSLDPFQWRVRSSSFSTFFTVQFVFFSIVLFLGALITFYMIKIVDLFSSRILSNPHSKYLIFILSCSYSESLFSVTQRTRYGKPSLSIYSFLVIYTYFYIGSLQ